MSDFNVLTEGADNKATKVVEGLGQGVVSGIIPHPVDSVAQSRADQAEPYVLGKASADLDMGWCDKINPRVLPKSVDWDKVLVYAGVVCLYQ